jgi:hypothetical protein
MNTIVVSTRGLGASCFGGAALQATISAVTDRFVTATKFGKTFDPSLLIETFRGLTKCR